MRFLFILSLISISISSCVYAKIPNGVDTSDGKITIRYKKKRTLNPIKYFVAKKASKMIKEELQK